MNRTCVALFAALLMLSLPLDAFAQAADKIKEAVRMKAAGKTDEAIALFETTIEADKSALAEPDGGLRDDLFAKYEKAGQGGDMAAYLKLGYYLDLYGRADDALAAYGKVASGADAKLAEEAKAHMASLRKEAELTKSGAGRSPSDAPPDTPSATGEPGTNEPAPPPEETPAETPPAEGEAAAPPADATAQKAELEEKIKAAEAELAVAEEEMKSRKRKWKSADGGNYDGDMRRRYRQAEEIYEAKAKEIEEMKQQVQAIESGSATPAPDSGEAPPAGEEPPPPGDDAPPSDAAPPAEEIVPAENVEAPSEPPAEDNGGY